ncbi:peptide-methionine (R)-S-oxide reductase [Jannaschia faecimaris]|uniref:peptide-methionine (R)-S-oxide reductase n=1 Tax=Jannaschia faecimaris TaxID=1244108 RepID=A0A1H3MSG0_9RHOB|nr:peptide-methionine (R)-S-oxide reductase [Jannaschia faecimaris]SDY79440.1 peptide-methionine (R)-S-oxide reductase [Jannaschia faecimaris]
MSKVTRRAILTTLPGVLGATAVAPQAFAATNGVDAFTFEVTRTEAEWRAMLTDDEYLVLRDGATEAPRSDPKWDSSEAGIYRCKGCDLPTFDARHKVVLDKGWLFFRLAETDSVLTSIDRAVYDQFAARSGDASPMMGPDLPEEQAFSAEEQELLDSLLAIEVHCRRCASHLGHHLLVDRKMLYCINGISLNFAPEAA